MNAQPTQPVALTPAGGAPERASAAAAGGGPQAGRAPAPVWSFILLFVLFYWGMVYFDLHGGWFSPQVYTPYATISEVEKYQPPPEEGPAAILAKGKRIYEGPTGCSLCHNNSGMGNPGQAPPFAGSEWVKGSAARMVRIPLVGLAGPITVKNQAFNLSMPAMGAALSDEDLAAVLTYIRSSWGNNASPISAEQVKAVRAEIGKRTQQWTADELMAVP